MGLILRRMAKSLKQEAVYSVIWKLSERFGIQIISFVVTIILSRILLPSDFGAIAMFLVVTAISDTIIEGGLASSLIRTEKIGNKDLSTVFWFNIVISILLYGLIFIVSPFISSFYNMPILTSLIRVYSIVIIINSFVVVQKALLEKELKFKTIFKIQLPSVILGGVSGVYFAYQGYGVWSLVYYKIIQVFVFSLQHWFYSNWKPSFLFDKIKFKYHFKYGYKLTLSSLLDTIFQNIYSIVIGKFFSSVQLGYYDRANTLKKAPIGNLSAALNAVTFPLFSKIANEKEKLREGYKRIMKIVIFILAPFLSLLIVVAEPLIEFLLTDKWLPAVPYFRVLVLSGILYPIHAYNLNILKVFGRSDLFLKLEVIKKTLIAITLFLAIPFGIMGIIWGQVITSVLAFFINTHYSGRFINYSSWHQIKDLLPSLLLSFFVAVIVYILNNQFFIKFNLLVQLTVNSITYALLYIILIYLLKFKEIEYLKEIIKNLK